MYLNIHFHYLINKINIIIFIILILLGVCFNVIPVITNNNIYFNRNVIYNEINNNNDIIYQKYYLVPLYAFLRITFISSTKGTLGLHGEH